MNEAGDGVHEDATPEGWSERGTSLPRLAIRRPVSVIMAFVALTVIGAIAYMEIPRQLLPSGFTPPFLFVQIPTRPSPPRDSEESIAKPIEEVFGTIRNVARQRTWINSGRVGFLMQFKDGTDMDVAYAQVRDRLERVMPDLPLDLPRYFIWKYNPNNEPIYWLGAMLPEGLDEDEASLVLDTKLVKRLERLPGVSRVEVNGAPNREIHVQLDDERANAAGIGTYELVQRLQQDNFAVAAGQVDDSGRRYPLRVVARYEDLDQVRAVPIGNGLRLRDVATVSYVTLGTENIYRVNGQRGVIVQVYKESTANTIAVCDDVEALVHSDDPDLARFHFIDFFNQGFYIQEALDNLQSTALWGGLFAVLVLFFFLRRVGITVVITLAIPVSVMATLVVMYFTQASLNALSLMGLMLSVGMVVDNSIVVVENIQRARISGLGAVKAAIYGTGEVALAIVVATSTSIVVFLPLILMSGSATLSFYLGKVGYPVCIALVASLAVSLVAIPLAATASVTGADKPPPRLRSIEWMEERFARLLDRSLRRRADALIIALLAFASVAYPMNHLKETDTGSGNPNDFRLHITFSNDMTHAEKDAYLRRAEQKLDGLEGELGVRDVLTRLSKGATRAQLRVFLHPPEARPALNKTEIAKLAKARMPESPGVDIATHWAERGGEDSSIRLGLMGPDSQKLAELAEAVAWRVRNVPGVISVSLETEDDAVQEVHVEVMRELAQRSGLTPMIIGGSIDYALRGRRLNDFHASDREVPMMIIAPESDRQGLKDLDNISLPDPRGGPGVAMSTLTQTSLAAGYGGISREDRRTLYELTVTAKDDDLAKLGVAIDEALKGFPFPRGYELSKGERFAKLAANQQEQSFALIMAVLCVFLLMGVLFESFILPFSIVVSIPFAFAGVYWLLYLTSTPFDVMAGIGLVILVGVVVNNAVVLIDLVGVLRARGFGRREALVEAGRKRLRPILMTALTTIFGLLPMALGTASLVGIPYAPLGRALIGGLTASTLLTLFVVPLCYTLFDDLQNALNRAVSWLALRRREQAAPGRQDEPT